MESDYQKKQEQIRIQREIWLADFYGWLKEYPELSLKEKKDRYERMDTYLDIGAVNPNRRLNEDDDRLLHAAVRDGLYDVAKLLLEYDADANAPNRYWQRPTREALMKPALDKETMALFEKNNIKFKNPPRITHRPSHEFHDTQMTSEEKAQLDILLLLMDYKADIYEPDYFGDSDFSLMDEKFYPYIMAHKDPSFLKLPQEQQETKTQVRYVLDATGLDQKMIPTQGPLPAGMHDKIAKHNRIVDQNGVYHGQRPTIDATYQFNDMGSQMTDTMFLPALLKQFGHYEAGGHTLNYWMSNTEPDLKSGADLPFCKSDFPPWQYLHNYLRKQVMHASYKWIKPNNIPILFESLARFARNKAEISRQYNHRPLIELRTLIDEPIELPDEWILVPIRNSDELKEEGDAQNNCLDGYLPALTSECKYIFAIRNKKNKPGSGWVFGLSLDENAELSMFADPVSGFDNVLAPPDIVFMAHSVMKELQKPHILCDLEEKRQEFEDDLAEGRYSEHNFLMMRNGFDPAEENAMKYAAHAAFAFAAKMGRIWPFYKMTYAEILEKTDINTIGTKMMEKFGFKDPEEKTDNNLKPAIQ